MAPARRRRGFGRRWARIVERFGESRAGQVGAQAVVHAAAERQDRRWALAGDVDAVRIVVDGGITVGRSGIHQDPWCLRGRCSRPIVDVVDDDAQGAALDRRMAHGFLDRAHRQFGLLRSSSHCSGCSQRTCTEAATWLRVVSVPASNRLPASMRSSAALRRSPSSSARIRSESRSSVRLSTPTGDHVVDVVVELTPRAQDDGLDLGEIDSEADDLEDVVGPHGELLPVLARCAEQRADDRDGVGPRDRRSRQSQRPASAT